MLIDTDLTATRVVVAGPDGLTAATARRLTRAGAAVVVLGEATAVTPAACAGARLGVLVGPATAWEQAREVLRRTCLVVDEPAPARERGRAVLVGAGPGGAELLTLGAVRALADADVVLADRLVEIGDLAALAPGAEIVDVGKRPGHHAVPQADIERLLVERARAGLTVVRLKGGDPYVFGRGGEEVAACVAAGVPVSVLPGVTSAIGVPGAAGIPVTHRGVSHVVTVLSGHVPLDDSRARGLVAVGGSLVVLMGVHNLVPITGAMVRAGLDPDTPAAVVERGLTPSQRSIVGTVATLPDRAARAGIASPAVVVIGGVVAQAEVWARRVEESVNAAGAARPLAGVPA
ncbi:uroporphyrinogen-III C-methyltransferase [Intrasporangium sp. YIM S08009]|uniref:uroporphyrinogen-III C-methyltransferase n=1 Tax=Intrasporangium zincisolvens TaxID=3080018 RepID=UPI002B058279|nr:uroporphyrinogen-III C-methyltransferase [Intrasporangium sp. YIM S08009]